MCLFWLAPVDRQSRFRVTSRRMRQPNIPSMDHVREYLAPLSLRQMQHLAALSGVPWQTIYKIKRGETQNPGVETCRAFLPYVPAAKREGVAA